MKKLLALMFVLVLLMSACAAPAQNAAGGTAAAPVAPAAASQDAYTFKFACDEAQASNQGIYAEIFKKAVEEKSGGKVKLELYYLGQLGDGSNQGELIQNGAIDCGFIAAGAAGSIVPESNIFSMHYIFPSDLAQAKKFLYESNVINKTVAAAYDSKNLHVVDWLDEGFMQWTTSTKPITSVADMKGMKMRVMSAPIITATYKAYGADPVTIPFSELYSGLQLNMADGQTNPVEIVDQMKFYEVQKYLSIGNSDLYVASLVFNKDLWESLPADIQGFIIAAVEETRPLYAAEQEKMSNDAIDVLKEKGMEVNELDDAAIAEFKELAQNAVSEFYAIGGSNAQALYEEFMAESATY